MKKNFGALVLLACVSLFGLSASATLETVKGKLGGCSNVSTGKSLVQKTLKPILEMPEKLGVPEQVKGSVQKVAKNYSGKFELAQNCSEVLMLWDGFMSDVSLLWNFDNLCSLYHNAYMLAPTTYCYGSNDWGRNYPRYATMDTCPGYYNHMGDHLWGHTKDFAYDLFDGSCVNQKMQTWTDKKRAKWQNRAYANRVAKESFRALGYTGYTPFPWGYTGSTVVYPTVCPTYSYGTSYGTVVNKGMYKY